jgi:hypothetical protein
LKAKIQFGNVKGPITFSNKLSVFHHDDIPEVNRIRHNDIINWKKSKILSTDKPDWATFHYKGPVCERRTMENFKSDRSKPYQYNYRAETLDVQRIEEPFDKPTKFHVSSQMESTAMRLQEIKATDRIQAGQLKRTQEMPMHSMVDEYPQWAYSTDFSMKDKDKAFKEMTLSAKEWSNKVTKTVPKRTNYQSPMQTTINFQEEVRRQKAINIFTTSKGVFSDPVLPVDRATLKNRFAVEKPVVRLSAEHSGVWEKSKVDGRSMWSDTGSNDFVSAGDIRKTHKCDSYNLVGPVTTPERKLTNSTARGLVVTR